jgi:hypothetical protein
MAVRLTVGSGMITVRQGEVVAVMARRGAGMLLFVVVPRAVKEM